MLSRKLLLLAFVLLANVAVADAGIIRHVIKPVAKGGAKVTKTVATKVAHAGKAVVY